jgi:inner membrane protein
MLWSLGAKWHAHTVFTDNLVEQNIEYTRLTTVPTPLNTLLWVGTADTDTTYHVALYSLLDSDREVEFYQVSNRHELLGDYANDEVVNRLKFLAKDWYAMRQYGDSLVFNDARFGAFFTDLDNPEYVFGYHLKEGEEGLEAIQGDPPTGEMEEVLKNLITRMLGE